MKRKYPSTLKERWFEFTLWYQRSWIYDQFWSIVCGIRNIFVWLPIVWEDGNWGYFYTEKVLRFKLKRMRDAVNKYDDGSGWELSVKQMDFCLRIMDRMENDYESYSHPDQLEYYRNKKEEDLFGFSSPNEDTKFGTDWYDWEEHWRLRDKRLLYRMLEKYGDNWTY